MNLALLLLAAGRGSRFGGPVPKAFLRLRGEAIVVMSARRLLAVAQAVGASAIRLVVTVHPDDRATHLGPLLPALDALDARIVDGGGTRQASMIAALTAAGADSELVLVHDAARPLFPVAAAVACVRRAAEVGAALLAIPAPDTLKRVQGDRVQSTLERDGVWQAQTPQVVRRDLLTVALARAQRDRFEGTDDVSLVEHLGAAVAVVPGSPTNLKITRPEDLPVAEALLQSGLA